MDEADFWRTIRDALHRYNRASVKPSEPERTDLKRRAYNEVVRATEKYSPQPIETAPIDRAVR